MCHIVRIKKIDLYIVTDYGRLPNLPPLLNMYDLSDGCRDQPGKIGTLQISIILNYLITFSHVLKQKRL
jgi:hypothetical protein